MNHYFLWISLFGAGLGVMAGMQNLSDYHSSRGQARQALYYSQGSINPIITREDMAKVEEDVKHVGQGARTSALVKFGLASILLGGVITSSISIAKKEK